jgi:hypothetical protein
VESFSGSSDEKLPVDPLLPKSENGTKIKTKTKTSQQEQIDGRIDFFSFKFEEKI